MALVGRKSDCNHNFDRNSSCRTGNRNFGSNYNRSSGLGCPNRCTSFTSIPCWEHYSPYRRRSCTFDCFVCYPF